MTSRTRWCSVRYHHRASSTLAIFAYSSGSNVPLSTFFGTTKHPEVLQQKTNHGYRADDHNLTGNRSQHTKCNNQTQQYKIEAENDAVGHAVLEGTANRAAMTRERPVPIHVVNGYDFNRILIDGYTLNLPWTLSGHC